MNGDPLFRTVGFPKQGIQSIVAGSGVSVDNTDPLNPIITAGGGGPIIIDVTLDNGANTLTPPAATEDGERIFYRLTQPAAGAAGTVTLHADFRIPGSATSPLPFSTVNSRIDYLAAVYDSTLSEWVVVSFLPNI